MKANPMKGCIGNKVHKQVEGMTIPLCLAPVRSHVDYQV